MAEHDKLKEQIDLLKKKYQNLFVLLAMILSGTGGAVYSIASGEKPLYMLAFVFLGLVSFIWVLLRMTMINKKLDEYILIN